MAMTARLFFCWLIIGTCYLALGAQRKIGIGNYPPLMMRSAMSRYPSTQYVTTLQDHFDADNHNTWQQAYFVNDTFWEPGSDAPIFLCCGGEGPALLGDAVVDSVHCSNAAQWLAEKKALMFSLEHRYYGCHNSSACPVSGLDYNNASAILDAAPLRFLSSHQAIEDIANFVTQMNAMYALGPQNKWVTWGGSYPGLMAGWSRLKHPELIHASVASSAPALAQLAMPEYYDIAAKAYTVSNNGVGGSEACRDAIQNGHREIGRLLHTTEGQRQLEVMFNLSTGSLPDEQVGFAGNGVANFPSQGNDPVCDTPACNIAQICDIMVDESFGDELARLVVLRMSQLPDSEDQDPWPFDFWTWQTCTEFGFYQTCDVGSKCMFTQGLMTLDLMTTECADKWNITVPQIQAGIDATNAHYGGLWPTDVDGDLGSCVMWPNGEVDPWSGLSVLEAPSEAQPVLWVDGASHHAWTHASSASDQASVVAARLAIRKQVDIFLQQDCGAKNTSRPQRYSIAARLLGLISVVVLILVSAACVGTIRRRKAAVRAETNLHTSLQQLPALQQP